MKYGIKVIHKTRLLAIDEDQILVIEKVGDKKKMTLAGGIKKKKESFEESLARETKEEIDLKINPNNLIYLSSNAKIKGDTTIIKSHFIMHTKTQAFSVVETKKFKDVYWIHWREALSFLDKEDKKAVKIYFKKKL